MALIPSISQHAFERSENLFVVNETIFAFSVVKGWVLVLIIITVPATVTMKIHTRGPIESARLLGMMLVTVKL